MVGELYCLYIISLFFFGRHKVSSHLLWNLPPPRMPDPVGRRHPPCVIFPTSVGPSVLNKTCTVLGNLPACFDSRLVSIGSHHRMYRSTDRDACDACGSRWQENHCQTAKKRLVLAILSGCTLVCDTHTHTQTQTHRQSTKPLSQHSEWLYCVCVCVRVV